MKTPPALRPMGNWGLVAAGGCGPAAMPALAAWGCRSALLADAPTGVAAANPALQSAWGSFLLGVCLAGTDPPAKLPCCCSAAIASVDRLTTFTPGSWNLVRLNGQGQRPSRPQALLILSAGAGPGRRRRRPGDAAAGCGFRPSRAASIRSAELGAVRFNGALDAPAPWRHGPPRTSEIPPPTSPAALSKPG